MKSVLLLFVLTNTLYGIQLWDFDADLLSNYTEISNFYWNENPWYTRRLSELQKVHFINATIYMDSHKFTNRLRQCVSLKFTNGTVTAVYISRKLFIMTLNNTSTEEVIIESGQEYNLRALIISSTKLTKIPENINQLKQINRIDIVDSMIEHITLNDFNGLDNLYEIDLSGNKIKHVYTNGLIRFRELNSLKISNNQLEHLDMCGWDMPSLYTLHVDNNQLTHLAVEHLHAITYIALRSNLLNCAWLQNFGKFIGRRHPLTLLYMIFRGDLQCSEESLGNFELHCPASLDHQRQRNFLQHHDLNDRLHKIESILQSVESQIIEQQQIISNVMQEM